MAEVIPRHEVWYGLRRGLVLALSVCAVFTAAFLIRGTAGVEPFPTLVSALVTCLASGAVGGLLFGLLHRWRSSILGGAGAGAIVAFGVVMTIGVFSGTTGTGWSQEWKALTMFTTLGAVVGVAGVLWRRRAG
jgi:hypothetical protein